MSADLLPFDRLERLVITQTPHGPRIDVVALARELHRYELDVQERLRRAALRAIETELARIQQERASC